MAERLPLISVVTPSFNQGAFIEQTILSVKAQGCPRVEHIIADAGSTDGTLEVIRRYEGTYPMRWFSEPDRGMYDAINKGLRMASGEILTYLNTDDVHLPWTLDTVARTFGEHPEADMLWGDLLIHDIHGHVHLNFSPPFRLSLMRRMGWSLPQPAVFWRRRVYQAVGGFDDSLRFVGDFEYWLRVAAEGFRLLQVREFLALARVHAGAHNVARGGLLLDELRSVQRRYATAREMTRPLVFAEKAYAWFWQRALMAQFLEEYVKRRTGMPVSRWRGLLGVEGLTLAPWRTLLRGFLPFGHRGYHRWILAGTVEWADGRFVYHGPVRDRAAGGA